MKNSLLILLMLIPLAEAQTGLTGKPVPAAPAAPRFNVKVAMLVQFGDESLQNQVRSLISRELRSLGDVTLVDETDHPDHTIDILGIHTHSVNGSSLGYAMAILFKQSWGWLAADFDQNLKGKIEEWRLGLYKLDVNSATLVRDFRIRSGNMDDLPSTCRSLVADFDTNILDWERKAWGTNAVK